MVSLTARQNRLLRYLLDETEAKPMADIGRQLDLTTRQVNYNLKGIRHWLEQHDAMLNAIPGKGVEIDCDTDRRATTTVDGAESALHRRTGDFVWIAKTHWHIAHDNTGRFGYHRNVGTVFFFQTAATAKLRNLVGRQ